MRFSVIQEPTGTWVVFDAIFELPAEIDGRLLIGLNRKEAERAALKANEEILRWRPVGANPELAARKV